MRLLPGSYCQPDPALTAAAIWGAGQHLKIAFSQILSLSFCNSCSKRNLFKKIIDDFWRQQCCFCLLIFCFLQVPEEPSTRYTMNLLYTINKFTYWSAWVFQCLSLTLQFCLRHIAFILLLKLDWIYSIIPKAFFFADKVLPSVLPQL